MEQFFYPVPSITTFMKKKVCIVISVLLVCVLIVMFSRNAYPEEDLILSDTTEQYRNAENSKTDLKSRMWMEYAISLHKKEQLSPSESSDVLAYVASIFYDIYVSTDSADQASTAVAQFLELRFPEYKIGTNQYLDSVGKKVILSENAREIYDFYALKTKDERYKARWYPGFIPKKDNLWYVVNPLVYDEGAMSGTWPRWVLSDDEEFSIPVPPAVGSLTDRLELEKVKFAAAARKLSDMGTVWYPNGWYLKDSQNDEVLPAGVWQNILFVEKGNVLSEREYAYAQKLLAQTLADAFMETWKVKYEYYTARPDMRMPEFSTMVSNPPFPAYPSGHSASGGAASVLLSYLFPDKKAVWEKEGQEVQNYRLVAGVHFDIDNKIGASLGRQVAYKILMKLFPHDPGLSSFKPADYRMPSLPEQLIQMAVLYIHSVVQNLRVAIEGVFLLLFHNQFRKPEIKAQIDGTVRAISNSFTVRERQILFIVTDVRLFALDMNDFYKDVTAELQLPDSEYYPWGIGVLDFDNDTCPDLFLSASGDNNSMYDRLYKNLCNGTFTDVTRFSRVGIKPHHGRGVRIADYNNDGYDDIYVTSAGNKTGEEPNYLYHNNGDGTFSEISQRLRIDGSFNCPNDKTRRRSIDSVWVDYNADTFPDLFVLNEGYINALYKNNGGKSFSDVTSEAGLCLYSRSLGAGAGDFDGDAFPDLFVVNRGKSYLWRNTGRGTFQEVSEFVGIPVYEQSWSAVFFNADGIEKEDIYIANAKLYEDPFASGDGEYDTVLLSSGRGLFRKAPWSGNGLQSRTVIVTDVNMDGKEDLITTQTSADGKTTVSNSLQK